MITYHEIRDVLRKMAVLDTQINHLRLALNKVSQVSNEIDMVSEDLATDRERFNCEIRSVEVLEQILQKHVYGTSDRSADDVAGLDPSGTKSIPAGPPGPCESERNQFPQPGHYSGMPTE